MLLEVCAYYHSLPPVWDMSIDHLTLFYDGIRETLAERQKEAKKLK